MKSKLRDATKNEISTQERKKKRRDGKKEREGFKDVWIYGFI